jgi:FkbM family methyltransferase
MTFRVLNRMAVRNGLNNVVLLNKAVGDENKTVLMNMPVFNGVASDAGSYVMQDMYYFDNPNVVEVKVEQVCIDGLKELNEVKIDAIKIDVENYEYHALKGASMLLMEQRPIIFSELWYGSENQMSVFDFIESVDYSIMVFDGERLVQFDPAVHNKLNYFFIPKEKIVLIQ